MTHSLWTRIKNAPTSPWIGPNPRRAVLMSVALGLVIGAASAPALLNHRAKAELEPGPSRPAQPTTSAADLASARALSRAFQAIAKELEPAVVHITQLNNAPIYQRDIFGFPMRTGETRLQQTGLGSGVIVSPDGYIVTNNHVVQTAERLLVRLTDRRELEAKVIGRDPATDLAVIKIDAGNLLYAQFADSDSVEVGEWVVAIGSPFGFSNTVTSGIVSAKGRSDVPGLQNYQDFIQTDAAVNPGNSGGPLLNLDGKIIGINSAIASRSGGFDGISLAIPSNVAKSVMDAIIKTGRVSRGWLGVDLGGPEERRNTIVRVGGDPERVRVARVIDDSPAARAGLRAGDTVLKFRGREIDDVTRLRTAIALTPPDTVVPIEIDRDGTRLTVEARMGDQLSGVAASTGGVAVPEVGVTLRTLDADEARRLGYRGVRGVQVVAIETGSRAANAELQIGDIIVAVENDRTPDASDAADALKNADFARGVRLSVIRGQMRGQLVIQD